MNKHRLGIVLALASATLVLLTAYMALFYAPIPQTSVRAAGELMSSIEGSKIRVAGFVTDARDAGSGEVPDSEVFLFSLADFTDYQRYLSALRSGPVVQPTVTWWTIRPVNVMLTASSADVPSLREHLLNGTNVSVLGVVVPGVAGKLPPDLGPGDLVMWIGFNLLKARAGDMQVGGAAGEFGLLSAPISQKIFYFHMPSAWVSYLAFFFALVFGVLYLRTRDIRYDRWAFSSAELGVLFATIAITTGPIWAKQEWGVYWRWDDTKLVTTFILWLVYIGYLMLRASITDQLRRARIAAVYGIIGFVTVPMSLLSSRIVPLLQSGHPQVIASSSGSLSTEAGITIAVAIIAFTLMFITMLIKRVEIAESEDEVEALKREIGGEE